LRVCSVFDLDKVVFGGIQQGRPWHGKRGYEPYSWPAEDAIPYRKGTVGNSGMPWCGGALGFRVEDRGLREHREALVWRGFRV